MTRAKTGLLPEHDSVATPEYDDLRMTIPAREALAAAGNAVEPAGAEPSGAPLFRVRLARPPNGIVLVLIGHGAEQHRGLRMDSEPECPGEWPAGQGISWWDRGEWVLCPACGASLVWYEAGYVPGYRVCSRAPHHHAILSTDGKSATLVRR